MSMRFIMLAVILMGLGVAGAARAGDTLSASGVLAQHGLGNQIAQAAGCANTCQLADSLGGKSCTLPTATGSTCTPVGSGCTCPGQIIGAMGTVGGTTTRKE
jgi:hypothetical protein